MIIELVLFDENIENSVIKHRCDKIHFLFSNEYIIYLSEALVKIFMDEHLVKFFFKDQALGIQSKFDHRRHNFDTIAHLKLQYRNIIYRYRYVENCIQIYIIKK